MVSPWPGPLSHLRGHGSLLALLAGAVEAEGHGLTPDASS
jgi:hypothetical protein